MPLSFLEYTGKIGNMVFCYQNCSDLLWEKIVLVKLLKFKAEGREFARILRSLEQFIKTVQGSRMLFKLVPGGFSDLINQDN